MTRLRNNYILAPGMHRGLNSLAAKAKGRNWFSSINAFFKKKIN